MVEGYFALGDETGLLRLCGEADIVGAKVLTRQGWARFASVDECLRIEIRGSPLATLVDDAAYQRVLNAARVALHEFCDANGNLTLPIDARIVSALKA